MSKVGSRLGAFEILELLGEGGMGEVYLAKDTRLGRKVAIKMLAGESLQRRKARDRFLREARTVSALNHPHICTLYDLGSEDDQMFLVMEYVGGRTLDELTPPEGMPVELVLAYSCEIASAMAHAHDRGVVHRDLKAANVMVTGEGRVKVLDFGLAAFAPGGGLEDGSPDLETLTLPGSILGTPLYMAPEQLRGEPADHRSDIWAFGVVLYEMACSRRPFSGKTAFEISSAALKNPPDPLPDHLPPALCSVIYRCLQKEAARRYQKSSEVCAALDAVQVSLGRRGEPPVTAPLPGALVSALVPGASDKVSRAASLSQDRRIESVAVLPLANLSGDPEQEYFSDGMTEALINDLAKIGALKVISRTSVMRYKESRKPLPEIADELGVSGVLEGSVLRSGEQVRITAQLIHAASDTNLWADSYTGDLKDIFSLQSEVAQAVAQRIQVALTAEERSHMAGSAVQPRAYEAYLKASHGRNTVTREGFKLGIHWAEEAIRIDPGYAKPYELLADIFLLLGMYGHQRPREVFPLAKRHAAQALALDESLAEAHSTMGWAVQVHDFDRAASEREYRRALELSPGHAMTLMRYGACLIGLGEVGEGRAMLDRSVELDPLSPIINAIYAYALYLSREYDDAIEHCRMMAGWESAFWWTHWDLGEIYVAQGRFDEAVAEHEKAFALERNPFTYGGLGAAYARAGKKVRATAMLQSMEAKAAQRYVPPYFIALLQEALGRREDALASLELAWEERDSWFSFAAVTPALDGLRSEPRLDKLLHLMGLRPPSPTAPAS